MDAFLAITLTPVLVTLLLRGHMRPESANPINRFLERLYTPVLKWCMHWRRTTLAINIAALAIGGFMLTRLGTEFMPPLDEGSILFMPVTLPDISNAEIKRILQTQDKSITLCARGGPCEGKAGRRTRPRTFHQHDRDALSC
ncbi:MAG: efflux RND transporter permease subunit [Flavobacteriales bacterium]|nr:efflux RND transporter permease subunit [Flavobacteriales bacterium]